MKGMKYCPKCQRVYEDGVQRCEKCRALLGRTASAGDPVLLLSASVLECERVRGALSDEGIPCELRPWGGESSAGVVTGYSPAGSAELFVPFSALERAQQIKADITAEEGEVLLPEEGEEVSAGEEKKDGESFEEMGRGKRIFWRIISVVLFILLIWAVVAGTDGIVGWIKQFF